MFLDEDQTLQWLGHLQRLASTGLLAGGMAHDLAGLIQPIVGECERVLLKDPPAEYRDALVRTREWARQAAGYVRALFDLVKRDHATRAPVPVEAVVEDTLVLLQTARRMAGVSVTRNLDNSHSALVDRSRLMQAIVNLVDNAVRAAERGGREVEVTVRGWRGWVLVEVEDNGPGVPEAIRDRIFQPFVHGAPRDAAAQEDRKSAGTGLGLYITKRLIEDQGGRIEYQTESGVGTTFRLLLEPAPKEKRSPGEA
jgi:signal transduction histidine kinase